ncbi:unnamed protein product [Brugia pahangi]|uniref:Secreted protein n=1 Tax=Brugia pahangi TaxID=6280 RepID=A0A0N4TKR6_BRUPA|nr:unnamed protein product [Brugia pahangi]
MAERTVVVRFRASLNWYRCLWVLTGIDHSSFIEPTLVLIVTTLAIVANSQHRHPQNQIEYVMYTIELSRNICSLFVVLDRYTSGSHAYLASECLSLRLSNIDGS